MSPWEALQWVGVAAVAGAVVVIFWACSVALMKERKKGS